MESKHKTLVCITSYNREKSLLRLLKTLVSQDCDIAVFDDASEGFELRDTNYIKSFRNPEHRGKSGFWKTWNDMFQYCKDNPHEYYIFLPDDVIPCPNFIHKAIEAYDNADAICISPFLTNRSILAGISRWGKKPILRHNGYYETHFFDCCGVVRRDFFEALDWTINPITPSSDPFRSSGVGKQITMRLQSAGKKMCHVGRTLLATDDSDSQMNAKERMRHPMYADWQNNGKCVDIHMASLWRNGHVVVTAESLMKQPELNTLYITFNNYTTEQRKQVRSQLTKLAKEYGKKVITRSAKNEKGSNEKMSLLSWGESKYIGFADDDIIYPDDYLLRLINACNIRKGAVTFHGSIIKEWPMKKYYSGRQMRSWNISNAEDCQVDILGTGVCLMRRDIFTKEELKALYDNAPATSMDDIIMSCVLAQKGISRWVIEHPSSSVKVKKAEQDDNYVYDRYRDDDSVQVKYIQDNYPESALVKRQK